MGRPTRSRTCGLGDVAITLRAAKFNGHAVETDPLMAKRRMLAEFCRLVGTLNGAAPPPVASDPAPAGQANVIAADIETLPPRLRQTLARLLQGDSEKQVALKLQLSPHTVHVYVKSLYRRFNVASRGELLARWVRPTEMSLAHPTNDHPVPPRTAAR